MRKRKSSSHASDQKLDAEREWREDRMRNMLRAAAAYEDEALRRALEPIGLDSLFSEIGLPVTAEALNAHPLMAAHYPLHLEVRLVGKSNPLPIPSERPLPPLKKMVFEFPDTTLYRRYFNQRVYDPDLWPQGAAVIFAYNSDGSLILHNLPDLSEGPPLVTRRLRNGCVLQIHYFEPFVDDVADACRYFFAEEGSKLMARIECNDDFRESSWADWEDREPPHGWE